MTGFFKKFADAFVEVEPDNEGLAAGISTPASEDDLSAGPENLDAITADASELLSQLGDGNSGFTSKTAAGQDAETEAVLNTASPSASATGLAMRMWPEQIFEQAGIRDGSNSAHRILKLISGLSMFPKDQQVTMIKAMDAADDSWTEAEVLEDARSRQSALRNHLKLIDSERDEFLTLLDAKIAERRTSGEKNLADIDTQIAELQARREAAIVELTTETENLEHQKKELTEESKKARHGLTEVINALSNLISFFNSTGAASPK
jgi:hypothetical protein